MRSLAPHPAIGQRQLDVFENGEVADQVKALEDEADLAIADAGAIRKRKIRDLGSLERIAAARWCVEQAKDGEQGRFAAARRTRDRHILALANVEVDAGERVRFHFIGQEDLGDAIELEEGSGAVSPRVARSCSVVVSVVGMVVGF